MFCYQCEQTAGGKGCTKVGVCGKQPDVAALQDLLVYALRGLAQVVLEGRKAGVNDPAIGGFICKALFSTLTNVNFDAQRISGLVDKAVALRDELKGRVNSGENLHGPGDLYAGRLHRGSRCPGRETGPPRGNGPGREYPLPQAHRTVRHQRGLSLCGPRADPWSDG